MRNFTVQYNFYTRSRCIMSIGLQIDRNQQFLRFHLEGFAGFDNLEASEWQQALQ
ncbi:hypothetical protein D3C75_1352110 [compost metagenome]